MKFLKYFKLKYLYRNLRFCELLALNETMSDRDMVFLYFKMGMYKCVLNFKTLDLSKEILHNKIISASYVGEIELLSKYIKIYEKYHSKFIGDLVQPLSVYSPKKALELIFKYKLFDNNIFLPLYFSIYGNELISEKYSNEIYLKSKYVNDFNLLYSNILGGDVGKKLYYLNKYLNYFSLSEILLKSPERGFYVNNLFAKKVEKSFEKFPLVSVLIPAFNMGKRITSCVESLMNQTYSNLEIIIINDASTDDTLKFINNLKKRYENIRCLNLPENVGPFVAKNLAALCAKGEFITTQDADDWAHPERISYQILPLLNNKKLVATTCQWVRLSDDGLFYAKQHFPFTRFNPSSPMFRKDTIIKYNGLWDNVRIAADTEFFERLKLNFGPSRIFQIKKPLVFGAHRSDSLMNAKLTGNFSNHMSPIRLAYWESWRKWHITKLKKGEFPYLSFPYKDRPFDVPSEILNPCNKLTIVYENFKKYYD